MKLSEYYDFMPRRSRSGNSLDDSLRIRPREEAVSFRFVQPNHENCRRWMIFDVDRPDAWFLPAERDLPSPTCTAINPRNGHAHIGYLLALPVSLGERAHDGPVRYYEAVRRGFTRRLGADWGYAGHLTKNPTHPDWPTDWNAVLPHRLDEMNDILTPDDKRWNIADAERASFGRNCTLFDAVRKMGYREVLKIKKAGGKKEEFRAFVEAAARSVNSEFPVPLIGCEIRATVKSITDWTWENYTLAKWQKTQTPEFSAIQRARVNARWAKAPRLTAGKPWELEGISRRTWERRRKATNI